MRMKRHLSSLVKGASSGRSATDDGLVATPADVVAKATKTLRPRDDAAGRLVSVFRHGRRGSGCGRRGRTATCRRFAPRGLPRESLDVGDPAVPRRLRPSLVSLAGDPARGRGRRAAGYWLRCDSSGVQVPRCRRRCLPPPGAPQDGAAQGWPELGRRVPGRSGGHVARLRWRPPAGLRRGPATWQSGIADRPAPPLRLLPGRRSALGPARPAGARATVSGVGSRAVRFSAGGGGSGSPGTAHPPPRRVCVPRRLPSRGVRRRPGLEGSPPAPRALLRGIRPGRGVRAPPP